MEPTVIMEMGTVVLLMLAKKFRKLGAREHQYDTDKNRDDTWMRRQLFKRIFFVYVCEKRKASGPHRKANGNLEERSIKHTEAAIKRFCNRHTDKA